MSEPIPLSKEEVLELGNFFKQFEELEEKIRKQSHKKSKKNLSIELIKSIYCQEYKGNIIIFKYGEEFFFDLEDLFNESEHRTVNRIVDYVQEDPSDCYKLFGKEISHTICYNEQSGDSDFDEVDGVNYEVYDEIIEEHWDAFTSPCYYIGDELSLMEFLNEIK